MVGIVLWGLWERVVAAMQGGVVHGGRCFGLVARCMMQGACLGLWGATEVVERVHGGTVRVSGECMGSVGWRFRLWVFLFMQMNVRMYSQTQK